MRQIQLKKKKLLERKKGEIVNISSYRLVTKISKNSQWGLCWLINVSIIVLDGVVDDQL